MIKAVVKLIMPPERLKEALKILRTITMRSRAETGCLGCSLYQDTENDQTIVYEENWKDEAALYRHLARDEYQMALLVMEMASSPPQIFFYTIKGIAGLEVIEKARSVSINANASTS